MKNSSFLLALALAFVASLGNALYAFGQKKSITHANPFLFGVFSLLTGAILLFVCASFFELKNIPTFVINNLKWFIVSGLGYVLLNLGLYFLYQNFGVSYYTLYAMLSILTTSILLATLVFGEKFNLYYGLSILFAFLTIFFFMKAKQ